MHSNTAPRRIRRGTRRLSRLAAAAGLAVVGALLLAPIAHAAPGGGTELAPTVTVPPISIPPTTIPALDPRGPDDFTDCPDTPAGDNGCGDKPEDKCPWVPGVQSGTDNCPRPPKPPCDANRDGKLTVADWFYLQHHRGACLPPKPPCDANHDGELTFADWISLRRHPDGCRPPCDANGDGKLNAADWTYLQRHPDACRPPKPPCDANRDGKLDRADWDILGRDPEACEPPPFRPPTRIDTGEGGTAGSGLNFGQLALLGAVVSALAGGIATLPRRTSRSRGSR